jgi:hypothetical protein
MRVGVSLPVWRGSCRRKPEAAIGRAEGSSSGASRCLVAGLAGGEPLAQAKGSQPENRKCRPPVQAGGRLPVESSGGMPIRAGGLATG